MEQDVAGADEEGELVPLDADKHKDIFHGTSVIFILQFGFFDFGLLQLGFQFVALIVSVMCKEKLEAIVEMGNTGRVTTQCEAFCCVVPELAIALKGMWTSKQLSVATCFGGDGGIILELNKGGAWHSECVRSFGCSWISSYHGDDECLFFDNVFDIEAKREFEMDRGGSACPSRSGKRAAACA